MVRWISGPLAAVTLAVPSAALAQGRDWSGFYIGVELGASRSDMDAAAIDPVNQLTNINPAGPQPISIVPGTNVALDQSSSDTNPSYGAVLGFQGQSGSLVFGLEGGIEGPRDAGNVTQANALSPTILSPSSTVIQQRSAELDYSWSMRGRIGVSLGRTLLYAAGGLAGTRLEVTAVNSYTIPAGNSGTGVAAPAIGPNVTTASARRSMTGWTAGVGGEQRLGRHISLGLDLRLNDYGSKAFTFTNAAIARSGATAFPGAEGGAGTIGPPNNDVRSDPGTTRIGLSEWRLAARLIFRF